MAQSKNIALLIHYSQITASTNTPTPYVRIIDLENSPKEESVIIEKPSEIEESNFDKIKRKIEQKKKLERDRKRRYRERKRRAAEEQKQNPIPAQEQNEANHEKFSQTNYELTRAKENAESHSEFKESKIERKKQLSRARQKRYRERERRVAEEHNLKLTRAKEIKESNIERKKQLSRARQKRYRDRKRQATKEQNLVSAQKNEASQETYSLTTSEGLLEEWNKAIPRVDRNLTEKDFICERHFKDEDLITEFQIELPNGEVYRHKRDYKGLKKDAVPSIFPGLPDSHYSTVEESSQDVCIPDKNQEISDLLDTSIFPTRLKLKRNEITYENVSSRPIKKELEEEQQKTRRKVFGYKETVGDEINEPIGSKPIKLEPDDSKPGTSKPKQLRSRKRKLVDRYTGSSATSSTETASTETASTEVASEGEPLSPEILATKIKVEVDDGSYDDHSVVDRTHAYVNPSALCESVIDTDKKFLVTDGQIIIPDVNVPSTIPNKSSIDRPSGNAVYGALLPSIPGYTFAPATQTSDLRTNLLPNIKVEVDDE